MKHTYAQEQGNEIFENKDEMQKSLSKLCNGDLYIIGRIWIEAMKTALFGSQMNLIPQVNAQEKSGAGPPGQKPAAGPPGEKPKAGGSNKDAPPEPTNPEKPLPMRLSELSPYECPYEDYQTYVDDAYKCPLYKKRLFHEYLLPTVSEKRKVLEGMVGAVTELATSTAHDLRCYVLDYKNKAKAYLRDPANQTVRKAIVAMGAVTGVAIGAGKGLIPRLFYIWASTMAAGAMTFPHETDEAFRNMVYHTAKPIGEISLKVSGKNPFKFSDKLPGPGDLPPLNDDKLLGACPPPLPPDPKKK